MGVWGLQSKCLNCVSDQMDLQVAGDFEELEPEPWKRSRLLTDKDPVLGGTQALCDTAGQH